jgi:hypothetical protein
VPAAAVPSFARPVRERADVVGGPPQDEPERAFPPSHPLELAARRRQRSAFIAETVRRALEDERRWEDIEAALGSLVDSGHDWDSDPAAWVRSARRGEGARVG